MTQPSPETPNVASSPVISDAQLSGSLEARQHDEIRTLASALAKEDQVGALVLKGVVTVVDLTGAPPTISINLSGDSSTTIGAVRFIDSYSPVVGDTVLIVKQGADLFALGQMNSVTGSPSENGWVTPSLGSGFTTHGIDPVRYRVVVRDGDRIVEMRGGVTVSGTPTALWTMPAGVRPVVNLLPLLVARDTAGGSNVAQLQVNSNGTMVLAGATTGGGTTGQPNDATTGTSSIGVTVNSTVFNTSNHTGHQHWLSDYCGGPPRDFTPDGGNGAHSHTVGAHGHGMAHTHEHPHTHTAPAVIHPTLLSFNGVSYVL